MSSQSLGELAARFNLKLEGDPGCIISRVAPLARAGAGELAFLSDRKRLKELDETSAAAIILTEELSPHFNGNKLISRNAHADFARIAAALNPPAQPSGLIHPSAMVSQSAQLSKNVEIGPNASVGNSVKVGDGSIVGAGCVLGDNAQIGVQCRLHANVTIEHGVEIGDRVEIHSGAVIGADGFGLAKDGDAWVKVPQLGNVVIGNDVEIGANTTIDRGALDNTVIGDGVKLDNQIQIAHNVAIGSNTAIAACVGIAGSAIVGERCTIGGAAVVLGHLTVTDDVHITAMSLVTKSIDEPGTYSSGTPLEKNSAWHRNFVRFKQLDDMAKKIARLEKRLLDQKFPRS